jgi:hypothetical protein
MPITIFTISTGFFMKKWLSLLPPSKSRFAVIRKKTTKRCRKMLFVYVFRSNKGYRICSLIGRETLSLMLPLVNLLSDFDFKLNTLSYDTRYTDVSLFHKTVHTRTFHSSRSYLYQNYFILIIY